MSSNGCPIRPLLHNVVLERVEAEEKSPGGIILPEVARETPQVARLVAEGALAFRIKTSDYQGVELPKFPACDQPLVLVGRYAGTEVKIKGKEYLVCEDKDILGVLDE